MTHETPSPLTDRNDWNFSDPAPRTSQGAVNTWFTLLHRLASTATYGRNISLSDSLTAAINPMSRLLPKSEIENLKNRLVTGRYLQNVRAQAVQLRLDPEAIGLQAIFIDQLYFGFSLAASEIMTTGHLEDVLRTTALPVSGGRPLQVRNIDLASGLFQADGLRQVNTLPGNIRLIAEPGTSADQIDRFTKRFASIYQWLLNSEDLSPVLRRGLGVLNTVYLTPRNDHHYACWAMPGFSDRVMIAGVAVSNKPYYPTESTIHELTHFGDTPDPTAGMSLTLMELHAETTTYNHFRRHSHPYSRSIMTNTGAKARLMLDCLHDRIPPYKIPEVQHVYRELDAIPIGKWLKLFSRIGVRFGVSPYASAPPPPPPRSGQPPRRKF